MSALNNETAVKTQYASSANLSTRISIHAKYSTNKQDFGNWIAAHYPVSAGMSVLELGCGTGAAWLNQREIIDACSRITLTDFSEGMLAKTKDTLKQYSTIEYAVVDIQHIPYADQSFDMIIANMMPIMCRTFREPYQKCEECCEKAVHSAAPPTGKMASWNTWPDCFRNMG